MISSPPPGPRRTGVYALFYEGEWVGRILVAYPLDGAGIVRLLAAFWKGPLKAGEVMRGIAGGYGYDKTSAAFSDALMRAGVEHPPLDGRGMGACISWLETLGYKTFCIL